MLKNYFKTAWRNLMKYKLYSFLNIAGLTVGILCSCLIFLYVTDELSYDNYSPLASRTYRINFFGKLGERAVNSAQSPAPAASTASAGNAGARYARPSLRAERGLTPALGPARPRHTSLERFL